MKNPHQTMNAETVGQALVDLRGDVNRLSKERGRWRRRSMAALTVALVASGAAMAAMSTTTHNFYAMRSDVFVYDETTLSIIAQGMFTQDAALGASGNVQASPVEATADLAAVNMAISAGDWFYQIEVKEAAVDSIASGTFKVELFEDGTSKGALYMTQGTPDALAVEGVVAKWSLGSSLQANAAYVVKVTAA